jgi:hypothetical protein
MPNTIATVDPGTRPDAALVPLAPDPVAGEESGLILGRPVEDRSFEVVEVAAAAVAGMAAGTVIAGPVGTAVGGVIGVVVGVAGAEALERAAGRAATTWDAVDHDVERTQAPEH